MVTSGGVSMGEYDLVKQLVGELGGIEVWQTAMQPAKPFAFGRLGGTPFFGLPGNPVSVMVAFEQFTRPALLQMMGSEKLFRPRLEGVLVGGAETDPAKTVFLRVRTWWEHGTLFAESSGVQSSNVLSALAAADAFAVVPEGVSTVPDRWPGDSRDVPSTRVPHRRRGPGAMRRLRQTRRSRKGPAASSALLRPP